MTCPALRDPRPTLHIAKALPFALEYAEVPSSIGSEEREREGKKKELYHIAGKISETKVGVSVCWGLRTMAAFCQTATSKVY